ncbi:hypothetical protein MD484_g6445, partial [Candolleomyces efflorescens]
MGETGSGKSQFINLATGSNLKVSSGARSCTQEVTRAGPLNLDGRQVYFYDTPGFDDTDRSELDILKEIVIALESQYRQGKLLHGIIYLHRISDIRVGGMAKANFGVFKKLCGDEPLQHVVLLTNMWNKVSQKEGEKKAKELAAMDDFFGYAIKHGAVMKDNNPDTVETAHEIVRHFLKKHPVALEIQQEIVERNLAIDKTSAGLALDDKLEQRVKRYERELRQRMDAELEARREQDEETRKLQEEESQRIRKLLEKLQRERSEQAADYKKLQEQLKATIKELNVRPESPALPKQQVGSSSSVQAAGDAGIVSGTVYTLYNKQHGLYATLHGSHIRLEAPKGGRDNKQHWTFTSINSNRWKIESVHSRRFVLASPSNEVRVLPNYSSWCVVAEAGSDANEYRICLNSANTRGNVIACERRKSGVKMVNRMLRLFDGTGGSDEIWVIEEV